MINSVANLERYLVYSNGTIISKKHNKKIQVRKQIKIYLDDSKVLKNISYARFVYYAFHKEEFDLNDKNIIICYKDNNDKNYDINNLYAINRKNICQGENSPSAKLTNKQVKEIKEIYALNKEQNFGKNSPITRISYRKLANIYGVSHTLIMGIINGSYRNSENYIIK